MRTIALLLAAGTLLPAPCSQAPLIDKPNILFIAIDDQNDWLGCLGGHPQAKTPHIDRLAEQGILFRNAYCQAPLCNPSRSSVLTGLRPSSTGIYGLMPGIREVDITRNHVTLPQTFTRAGYYTATAGKIYHDGAIKPKDQPAEFNTWAKTAGTPTPPKPIAQLPEPRHPAMDWGAWPARDEDTADYKTADATIAALKNAPKDRPFFILTSEKTPSTALAGG